MEMPEHCTNLCRGAWHSHPATNLLCWWWFPFWPLTQWGRRAILEQPFRHLTVTPLETSIFWNNYWNGEPRAKHLGLPIKLTKNTLVWLIKYHQITPVVYVLHCNSARLWRCTHQHYTFTREISWLIWPGTPAEGERSQLLLSTLKPCKLPSAIRQSMRVSYCPTVLLEIVS